MKNEYSHDGTVLVQNNRGQLQSIGVAPPGPGRIAELKRRVKVLRREELCLETGMNLACWAYPQEDWTSWGGVGMEYTSPLSFYLSIHNAILDSLFCKGERVLTVGS